MKPPIRQLKRWIAALDSGEYKQGQSQLQVDNRYCCLGVGCRVLIPDSKLRVNSKGQLIGNWPVNQPGAPEWLIKINTDLFHKTGKSLISLNDIENYTFPEIATLLELVYVHKMLD